VSEPIFVPAQIAPTPEQLAIQTARARHLLIEANAGAAKTTTLALRIAQALQRGADPAMVLALTYTAPAVQALQAQLRLIGLPAEQLQALRIETFESFSAAVLAELEGPGAQRLSSLEQLKDHVLRAIERAQSWEEERYPEEMAVAAPSEALVEGLLQSFAVLKGRLLFEQRDPQAPLSPALAEELGCDYFTLRVRSAFEAIRRGGHPDHPAFRGEGDACYDLACALLGEEELPLSTGLALIVVDEMHDTNRAMFTVLKALLQHNRRAAFVGVGDRDQVIHSQAGAEAGFMHEHFEREIGPPLRLPLSASHRFGPALAQAAGALARKPYAAHGAQSTELCLLPAESHRLQAQLIARSAQAHLAQNELAELCILLRRPAQSILIERELLKLGIGYAVQGLQPFLQRREVLLVRGLQAFASGDFAGFASRAQRSRTLEALMLFAGAWIDSIELRHVDAMTAQRQAIDAAAADPQGMHDFIQNQVLRNASSFAAPRLRAALAVLATRELPLFARDLLAALDPLGLARAVLVRQEDIRQVHDNVVQLQQLVLGEGEGLDSVFQLLHALELAQTRQRGGARVGLCGIEAVKGLEFDHVLIPHLSRGEFVGEGSAAENRNLLYVAMTRARRRLSLAFNPAAPSRYLLDAGLLVPG
jgi:DNA helicase-2/ATP-dependent DNA helicase PcrA